MSQPPTCIFQMGENRKPLYHFSFLFFFFESRYLTSDHLPTVGFDSFVPFPFALFPKSSTVGMELGGHPVPHRADSCRPVLSGLKQI